MATSKFRWTDNECVSLNAASSGIGAAIPLQDCRQVGWFTQFSGTITGGTIIVEWSPDQNYTGTWAQLDTINAANLAGGLEGFGTYAGPVGFLRARISVAIVGGTITTRINGLLN